MVVVPYSSTSPFTDNEGNNKASESEEGTSKTFVSFSAVHALENRIAGDGG
jgi:hypothetical protein